MTPIRRSLLRRCVLATLAALVVLMPSCKPPVKSICTLEARAGLWVEVRDSLTGAPAGEKASVVAKEEEFEETLRTLDGLAFSGLYERKGNYSVSVQKIGYQNWQQEIRVTGGECHVKTVHLQVKLERIS